MHAPAAGSSGAEWTLAGAGGRLAAAFGAVARQGEVVVADRGLAAGDEVGDERAEFWTGLRPMTPDSTPIIGATAYPELFLNTGHGTLGWTMSCGAGQLVADLVTGRQPAIRHDDLGLTRYAGVRRRAARPNARQHPLGTA